ncbi:hypothetical protein [Petrachloros mirabilis]
MFLWYVFVAILVTIPQVARAEESEAQTLPDRLMVRGGYAYVFGADTALSINGTSGIGAAVDFSRALDGQREDHAWRIDSLYRFNLKHSVGFSYYNVIRKGNTALTNDIPIGDTTYKAGSQIKSQLDTALYRLFYNYSFHHDDKVELGASVGLYLADIRARFSGNFSCTGPAPCTGDPQTFLDEDSQLTAPLPSVGFLVNYNFTPRLVVQTRFDWFYFETSQFKGTMNELYASLEYRLFKHLALGAAYDRLDVNFEYEAEKTDGWIIRNDWNIVYLFGTLYF